MSSPLRSRRSSRTSKRSPPCLKRDQRVPTKASDGRPRLEPGAVVGHREPHRPRAPDGEGARPSRPLRYEADVEVVPVEVATAGRCSRAHGSPGRRARERGNRRAAGESERWRGSGASVLNASGHAARAALREGLARARLSQGRARDPRASGRSAASSRRRSRKPRRAATLRLLRGPADGERPAAQRARAHARHQGPLPALQDDARLPRRRARRAGTRTACPSRSRSRRSSASTARRRSRSTASSPSCKKCIESVFRYTRSGRSSPSASRFWVDLDDAYVTYHQSVRRERVVGALASSSRRASSTRATRSSGGGRRAARRSRAAEVGQGYKTVDDPTRVRRASRCVDEPDTVARSSGRRRRGPCRRTCTPRCSPTSSTSSCAPSDGAALRRRRGARRGAREEARARARRSSATLPGARARRARRYVPPFDLLRGEARVRRRRLARRRRRLRHARRRHRHRPHRARLRRGRLRGAPQRCCATRSRRCRSSAR